MKNSKKSFNSAGQSPIEVKKSQKHDANLQKNSTLYFQIGLILCLLGTYSLFEMQFQDKKIVLETAESNDPTVIHVATVYQLEPKKPEAPKPKKERSKTLKDKFELVEDDPLKLEDEIFSTDDSEPVNEPLEVGSLPDNTNLEDEEILVPFVSVEKVPVYPGCERKKTNDDKRKCMSKKISRLINNKFNTGIANEYSIYGLQKIDTQFTVDKNGNITDIKIRGPHPALEKEAERVINKIPIMEPGYQRDKPVGVIYNLPIKFLAKN
ncbi:energy transducer TonB [Winogradskyella sp.]|uniref:energy transducer TonB n=1 Tax=Winogradskyella sp. TaxID=1883156 RepID=UPI0026287460|nr:energy transducer TonB [Winogradskyella sp.]